MASLWSEIKKLLGVSPLILLSRTGNHRASEPQGTGRACVDGSCLSSHRWDSNETLELFSCAGGSLILLSHITEFPVDMKYLTFKWKSKK